MILLDTNVLSAMMHGGIYPAVVKWLDAQPGESVWTSAISVFEVRFGLEIMAKGRRRRALEDAFAKTLSEDLENRVLPFDSTAAEAAAIIAAHQRSIGRPVEIRDVQIAGIAAARKAVLATRNSRHFEDIGISVTNPWTD
jgi:predicted nucleic acid-binding protein